MTAENEAPETNQKSPFASAETIESLRLQRDALVDALADQHSSDPDMVKWLKRESLNMHVPAISRRKLSDELTKARQEADEFHALAQRISWYLPSIRDTPYENLSQKILEALADAKAEGMLMACEMVPKPVALVLTARANELRREVRATQETPPRSPAPKTHAAQKTAKRR